MSYLKPLHWVKLETILRGSLWDKIRRQGDAQTETEFDVAEIVSLFSTTLPKPLKAKPEKIHLIEDRKGIEAEVMLMTIRKSLPDLIAAIITMDESVLGVDQLEKLLLFCPTKKEMDRLKKYTGDTATLGKCEQYFLELMKVPRVESKLRAFYFKIRFYTQITELKTNLNAVNSACEEVLNSHKLKEIMKRIPYLGYTLTKETESGAAAEFKLDGLLKLSERRVWNRRITLMNYFCKVLASEQSDLLDFHKDLENLDSATQIKLSLAKEMQAIVSGMEKLKQELTASESDGPVSQVFRQTLKDFISIAETEMATVLSLNAVVGRNSDALALYIGEDPNRCPFEKATATLLNFVWLFKKAVEENVRRAELEIMRAERVNARGVRLIQEPAETSRGQRNWVGAINQKVQLIDVRRAHRVEIMLSAIKMPLPDIMTAVLAMDESVLNVDQIEKLVKHCPFREEKELLQNYSGDPAMLGKCEQYFLELMKVPGAKLKLKVFLFKIQFSSQVTEITKSLNVINSACMEVFTSQKLKEIMKKILYLGNTLNQGTPKGGAVGFKLESLVKLSELRANNSTVTLMHYLCKVLASRASDVLDFHKDLESLESASRLLLRALAMKNQDITKGLERVKQEVTASKIDGPVFEVFHKTLKDFIPIAETEVAALQSLYSVVGRKADAFVSYFGENPRVCRFEEVTAILVNFIRLFKKAHEENVKQAELEKRKAFKEAEWRKLKESVLQRKGLVIIADTKT